MSHIMIAKFLVTNDSASAKAAVLREFPAILPEPAQPK